MPALSLIGKKSSQLAAGERFAFLYSLLCRWAPLILQTTINAVVFDEFKWPCINIVYGTAEGLGISARRDPWQMEGKKKKVLISPGANIVIKPPSPALYPTPQDMLLPLSAKKVQV